MVKIKLAKILKENVVDIKTVCDRIIWKYKYDKKLKENAVEIKRLCDRII